MIKWIKGLYSQYIRTSRKKKHDYLGMMINLSVRGPVAVTMEDYLKAVVSDFEEVEILTGTAASTSLEHLYAIR